MGMSTHIKGFRPPDERWQQMKTIWDACQAAGIDVPDEVERFFEGMPPDPNGVETDIPHRDWSDHYRQGIEVDIAAIPKHVTVIRFYNSW